MNPKAKRPTDLAGHLQQLFLQGKQYPVTQAPGPAAASTRKFYSHHTGYDLGTPAGTPITPSFSGKVVKTYQDTTGFGLRSVVYNPQEDKSYYLSHLSKAPVVGDFKAGTPIAYTGGIKGAPGSGNTTGAHLDINVSGGFPQLSPYVQALGNITRGVSSGAQRALPKLDINSVISKAKSLFGNKVKAVSSNPGRLKGNVVKFRL